jgi:hypothetical protein
MKKISVIDSHTGAEPTRLIVAGGPDLGSGTLAQRLQRFRTTHDRVRSAAVCEPRGSDVVVGALRCTPNDPSCSAGVIFFNNVGFLGFRIAVIECDAIGSGATAAGMGHLVVMDDNPAELALTRYSLALWRTLTADSAMLHEYRHCGTIWIAADDEEMAAARSKQQTLQSQGIACELLDARAL